MPTPIENTLAIIYSPENKMREKDVKKKNNKRRK